MGFPRNPVSLSFVWAVWCSCSAAVRFQMLDAMHDQLKNSTADANVQAATCPSQSKLECKDAKGWLESQHRKGHCPANEPRWIRCKAGKVPSESAWFVWKGPSDINPKGDRCSDYYVNQQCLFSNFGGHIPGRLKTTDGGGCLAEPKLSIKDCELIGTWVSQFWGDLSRSNSSDGVSKTYPLVQSLLAVYQKAPKEWIWLPPLRFALSLLSYALAGSIEVWNRTWSHEQMQEIWLTFLLYCQGAKRRQSELNRTMGQEKDEGIDAFQIGQNECIETTPLRQLFDRNPWREALKTDPATIKSLLEISTMGLFGIREDLLEELSLVAAGRYRHEGTEMMYSYQRLKARFQELLLTAGDRGEQELQLGLTLSNLKAAEGVRPVGGERRLAEIRAFRNLKNYVESSSLETDVMGLRTAMHKLDKLVEDGQKFEWIDDAQVTAVRERAIKLEHAIKLSDLLLPHRTTPAARVSNTTDANSTVPSAPASDETGLESSSWNCQLPMILLSGVSVGVFLSTV
mmetsp:Transcript_62773/g.119236  ORF Transcript_62773/g.119236 Transcript_62773/m.119236 type:complete len:514 (+) Transcript_62773:54-1595(+)